HMDATVDISKFKIIKNMFPETAGKYAGPEAYEDLGAACGQRVATRTFQAVSSVGRSIRTLWKPARRIATATSPGARVVKISLGMPMRSIFSLGRKPTIARPPDLRTRALSAKPASSDVQK